MQDPDPNPNSSPSTSRWLIVAMAFFLISLSFLIASRRNGVDIDLFHQMCLARQFSEEGTFPMKDAFAYTPTVDPIVHHEWMLFRGEAPRCDVADDRAMFSIDDNHGRTDWIHDRSSPTFHNRVPVD
jgi:hypothetical protein